MKQNFIFYFFGVFMFLGFIQIGNTQTLLAEFDRANNTDCVATSTWVTSNLTASTLCRGAGIAYTSGGDYNSNGFGGSFDSDDYISFSITPDATYTLDITEIKIRLDRSSTGPSNFVLRSNQDAYVSDLFTESALSASGNTYTISLSLTGITSEIEFRVFAWGASSGSGTFDVEGFAGTNMADPGIQITGTLTNLGGNNPPVISNIIQNPSAGITSSTAVSVSADVTDTDGTITGVELHWGTASGVLGTTIAMPYSGSGDTYTTTTDIPAQANGTTVFYEVYAVDDDSDGSTSAEI
ncbi:MAG: hypothetical protein R2750_05635 [Bacteroidales bacterium]